MTVGDFDYLDLIANAEFVSPAFAPGTVHVDGWTGIDTMRVWAEVPPDAVFPDSKTQSSSYVDKETGEIKSVVTRSTAWLSNGVAVDMASHYGRNGVSWEVSLPKLLRGHNGRPVSLDDAIDAQREMFDEVSDLVTPLEPFEALRISRLDMPRDFYAPCRVAHLEGQRFHSPSFGKEKRAYSGPSGSINTISYGTKGNWNLSVYDKQDEFETNWSEGFAFSDPDEGVSAIFGTAADVKADAMAAVHDRLRVELGLRSRVLTTRDMHTIADLDETKIDNARRHYFFKLGLDTEVTGTDSVTAKLAAAQAKIGARTDAVVGSVVLKAAGLPSGRSRNTAAAYRRLAQKAGLSAGTFAAVSNVTTKLDYDRGELLAT